MPTPEQYAAAFERERVNEYPVIDEFERRMGFAVDRDRLEAAARVLACPVKKSPPNWQHGRILYALGRKHLEQSNTQQLWIDIGTAKGFSSVCMMWALDDAKRRSFSQIYSFDIIDPESRERRNSVEDGKTIDEFVSEFAPPYHDELVDYQPITFPVWAEAISLQQCIDFAFVDGSHQYSGVKADIEAILPHQARGDIILFDDLQKEGVARAVSELQGYDLEYIEVLPTRKYAIAVKH